MSAGDRAARDGRDRSTPLPGALLADWQGWSRELAAEGIRLIRAARRIRNPKQASDNRRQGIDLLKAAETFALRAHRNQPDKPGDGGDPASEGGLDAFRKQRDA